jgi:hypothetical protein
MSLPVYTLIAALILAGAAAAWARYRREQCLVQRTPISLLLMISLLLILSVLAITGLPTLLRDSGILSGNMLLAHVAAGGAFLFVTAIGAVAWAPALSADTSSSSQAIVSRGSLWLFLLASIATGLPVLLAMTSLFDSSGQRMLMLWHSIAAAVLLATLIPLIANNFTPPRKKKGNLR